MFLHHSTGGKIWGQTGSTTTVPAEIDKYNASYNLHGTFTVSLDEMGWPDSPWQNEWERWHRIFCNQDTANADIRPILAHSPIVIIKSCFPSSSISRVGSPADTLSPTSKTIYNYKWHWRSIIAVMRRLPENFFVIWTNAPLVAAATSDLSASLSDQFCRWAKDTLAEGNDPVVGPFPNNVYVFDFFHKLAGPDGKLPAEYAASSTDSHPNAAATDMVAPRFVQETFDHALQYENFPNRVRFSSFHATIIREGAEVLLEWTTSSEFNNYGFYVARRAGDDDEFIELRSSFIVGNGTTTSSNYYSYIDCPPSFGSWAYRISQIGFDSTVGFSDTVKAILLAGVEQSAPSEFHLLQNYPNPFNPSTEIAFSVDARRQTQLAVFSLLGERVTTLVDRVLEPGIPYRVTYHAGQWPAGIYFYRLQSGEKVAVRKMILLK